MRTMMLILLASACAPEVGPLPVEALSFTVDPAEDCDCADDEAVEDDDVVDRDPCVCDPVLQGDPGDADGEEPLDNGRGDAPAGDPADPAGDDAGPLDDGR